MRQRAVDLLYAMCDRSNAKQIVAEMLSYLETADYSIREEIVSSNPVSNHFSNNFTNQKFMIASCFKCH